MKELMSIACTMHFTSTKKIAFQRWYISNYKEMSYNRMAIRGYVIKTTSITSTITKERKIQYNAH